MVSADHECPGQAKWPAFGAFMCQSSKVERDSVRRAGPQAAGGPRAQWLDEPRLSFLTCHQVSLRQVVQGTVA